MAVGGMFEADPQNKQRGAGRGRRTRQEGPAQGRFPRTRSAAAGFIWRLSWFAPGVGPLVARWFRFSNVWRLAWVLVVVFAPVLGCAVVSFVLMFGM